MTPPQLFGYMKQYFLATLALLASLLSRRWLRKTKIWIIGENFGNSRQDNGYVLYQYCREIHTNKEVYFVTRQCNTLPQELQSQALEYGSFKHYYIAFSSDVIIRTHSIRDVVAGRGLDFFCRGKRHVFLQHGVLGLKNVDKHYSKWKNTERFIADLFIVSSRAEKNIVLNELEYQDSEIAITGLARHDLLRAPSSGIQILIFPTWIATSKHGQTKRKEILNNLIEALVKENHLKRLLAKRQLCIRLVPHVNLAPLKLDPEDLANDIEVGLKTGETLSQVLRQSDLLITDYSSLSFDALYYRIPTLFYHQESDAWIAEHLNPYTDLRELCGEFRLRSATELASRVRQVVTGDLRLSKSQRKLRQKYFEHNSTLSITSQIFSEIKSLEFRATNRKRSFWSILMSAQPVNIFLHKLRGFRPYRLIMRNIYNIYRLLPKIQNGIFFESYNGKRFAGDPKALYLYISREYPSKTIIWSFESKNKYEEVLSDVICVNRFSPSYYFYLARCRIFVSNMRFPPFFRPNPKDIVYQSWHGTPLKKVGSDVSLGRFATESYKRQLSEDASKWSVSSSSSRFMTSILTDSLGFAGKTLQVGSPRNDALHSTTEHSQQIKREQLGITDDKILVLYAPTWRDQRPTDQPKTSHIIDFSLISKHLQSRFKFLNRAHHLDVHATTLKNMPDFATDMSHIDDVQDLIIAADILVTDYSSVLHDFNITRKPTVLFVRDFDDYKTGLRGLYSPKSLKELCDEIVTSEDQLVRALKEISRGLPKETGLRFRDTFSEFEDGKATEKVSEYFFCTDEKS